MPHDAHRLGSALVAGQFALMGVIGLLALASAANGQVGGTLGAIAVLSLVAAAAVGLAALAANPPGNFNIRPDPRAGGRLVTGGIYRRIRHPMYTAVLLAGASGALAAAGGDPWRAGAAVAAWLALAAVLRVKAGVEERAMTVSHPGYAEYLRRTRRFVPGVW